MPGSLRIAIVGGGIGGLTAALAFRARGLDVTVFEQAEVLREIGAGVSLHPNAARLLKRIGLDDQLRKIGSPISNITLRTSQGDAITTPAGPATPAFSRDGGQGYNVHRADFLNLLFAALPKGTVNLGHRCIQLGEDGDRVRFSFANGVAADADVVYFSVFGAGTFYLLRLMARKPERNESEPPHTPQRAAGIAPAPGVYEGPIVDGADL